MPNTTHTMSWLMLILLLTSVENLKAERDMRNYPSIFQAWNGIENRPNENELHRLARHDLIFHDPYSLL